MPADAFAIQDDFEAFAKKREVYHGGLLTG